MTTPPLSPSPFLRQGALAPRERTTGAIRIALTIIISLGIGASLVWVGCFRIREDRSVVLADLSEIVSFLESLSQLMRSFN